MKVLKKILLVIAIIIAIPLLAAIFIPKDYKVNRSVTIDRPATEVFQYVKLQKNQDHYNKWVMADPAMQKNYRGNDGDVGFVYAWDSKTMGKGEQEIKSITEGKEVTTELRFEKPMESVGIATITTEPVSQSHTRVAWTMKGRSPYPFNLMNLFMDGMLGSDMESSLALLKNQLESK